MEQEITPVEQEVTPVFNPHSLQHIKAAKEHANPKWVEAALKAVKKIAKKKETLTTTDVLNELDKLEVKTHSLKAIGPVMIEAKRLGWIESDGFVRMSRGRTRGITVVWRSKIHTKAKADKGQSCDITTKANDEKKYISGTL